MTAASASRPSLTGQTSSGEGFLAVARRWWMLLVLAPLVCAALAYVYATFTTPTYEAEARLLVVPGTVDSSGLSLASDSAPTYVELVTSPAVLGPTVKELALPYGVDRLRTKVRAEADRATRLVTIRARDDDSARAAATATELARRLKIYVDAQPRSAGAPSNRPKTLEIVERGTSSRVGPNVGLSTSFGAFAGLLLSIALALLLGANGGSVASGEELGVLTQAPFLGAIQRLHQGRRAGRGAQAERSAESFVGSPLLAGRLRSTGQGRPVRSLLLIGADTSSSARDLAANLAATYAAGGLRTKLVSLGHDKKSAGRIRVAKRDRTRAAAPTQQRQRHIRASRGSEQRRCRGGFAKAALARLRVARARGDRPPGRTASRGRGPGRPRGTVGRGGPGRGRLGCGRRCHRARRQTRTDAPHCRSPNPGRGGCDGRAPFGCRPH